MFSDKNNPKNLKDISTLPRAGIALTDNPISISYTKADKLIMALYMVTDIMDTSEPMRPKLRSLGVQILSDIRSEPEECLGRIREVMSFLEIALAVNLVSSMNGNILKKEFSQLKISIEELFHQKSPTKVTEVNLSDFFTSSLSDTRPTRIGVQKGSTLMKALSDKTRSMSDRNNQKARPSAVGLAFRGHVFDTLKKERREQITDIVRKNSNGVTITDIRKFAYGSLASCGEKTLQRELVNMVGGGILRKTGEKRWSRYYKAF